MEAHGNRAKGKRWKSVIEKRLEELKAMEQVADALIRKAMDGDVPAIKEIGDRLDGKSRQQLDIGGQEDNPMVSEINIKLVKAGENRA